MRLLVVDPMLPKVTKDVAELEACWERLRASRPDLAVEFVDQSDLPERIGTAHAVAGFVPPEALQRAEQLNWVHSWAAGPQDQLYSEFVTSGVTLTCSKGNGAIPLAEHAMLLMLALARDLTAYGQAQQRHAWEPHLNAELAGSVCAILGGGNAARELARRAKAFGMRVLIYRRTGGDLPEADQVYFGHQLGPLLEQADWLVNTLPRTIQTIGLIGAPELGLLKRSARYICVSRGGVVDDEALISALREGRIAGAGLDAHLIEPLPEDSPYWDLPNTIVTPHDAAHCKQTHMRGFEILIDNLARYGVQPLRNVVDPAAGY